MSLRLIPHVPARPATLFPARAPALLAAAVLSCALPAQAAFSGDFGSSHWQAVNSNGGNGRAVLSADGAVLVLTSSDFAPFDQLRASTLDYSITLAQDTTLRFDWSYVSDDDSSTQDPFGYRIGTRQVQLSADGRDGAQRQAGSVTVAGRRGEVFSFVASSLDSVFGAATTRVSGFSATSAVPEPAPAWLMLAGAGMLALVGTGRRRLQRGR